MSAISVETCSWKSGDAACRGSEAVTQPTYFRIAALLLAALTGAYAEEGGDRKRGNPLWEVSLADLRTTAERPLFSPSRRPQSPLSAAPPVVAAALAPPRLAEPEDPPFALLGTIVGERTEIAVFLDEATKDIVHLKVGQDRGGWTLRSVQARQVDFARDRWVATLSLKRDADDRRPATPPIDVAASASPDMGSSRAALRQRRGR